MPNITKTVADVFLPEAWANRLLDLLKPNLVMARIIAKDTDFEPGWKGKTLNINYPGTFVAQDKVADTPIGVQTPAGASKIPVVLDKHKAVDFIVEDVARAQSERDLMDTYVEPAAQAIVEAVENDIFALYAGLSTQIGTSGTDITPATVRTARKTLNDKKVPLAQRHLVISSKDEIALLANSELQTYFSNSNTQGITEGAFARLYGFDLHMSQLVPVVAGAPNSTKNLALHRNAFILAVRPMQDPPADSGVAARTIRDPDTGLIIRVLTNYDMGHRGQRVGFDILYGTRELRDEFGAVVLS